MTPPNLSGMDLAAWYRRQADSIEAEERARRPALAAGQVWRHVDDGDLWLSANTGEPIPLLFNIEDGSYWSPEGFDGEDASFEYVGLARDVLRVVPPDPPAPQVAPEPTGAELVGRRCWVRDGADEDWRGPKIIGAFDPESQFPYRGKYSAGFPGMWSYAKPYVEGVAP